MKKLLKSITSVLLCISIAAGLSLPSFATADKTAFIVVSGMNTFPLYENGETQVYPIPTQSILKTVAGLTPPLLKFFSDRNYDALGDKLFPALRETFGIIACNKDGDSVLNIDTKTFDTSAKENEEFFIGETKDELAVVRAGMDKFGAENTYFFNYDWRGDPLEHADGLNSFIQTVKEQTGCKRIALAAFSMGGTVTCSYLYKYGSSDVDSIILCSTAFQGTSCMGSLFTADLSMSMSGLIKRMAQLTRDNTPENLIDYLNDVLTLSGINGGLEDFANNLTDELKDRIYNEFIIPVFGYMPGLWALVDDVNYEKAKDVMLDKNENSKLLSRIDEYHYNVQQKAKEILTKAKNDTTVYIIAQYNMQGLPISETATKSNNDYLIDACYASGGATCSALGGTLPDGYVQAVNDGHNHLSADIQIDASTCMYPENTWFIRDMGHVDYPYGESTDFILWLASSEKQLTVNDNENYTQFMTYSYSDNTLTPVTENNPSGTTSDVFFNYLLLFTNFIYKIISMIFAL